MLDTVRRELEQYEGMWMLPDDLDALLEIIERGLPKHDLNGRPRTHRKECWRYHHACAVAEIERLQATLGDKNGTN